MPPAVHCPSPVALKANRKQRLKPRCGSKDCASNRGDRNSPASQAPASGAPRWHGLTKRAREPAASRRPFGSKLDFMGRIADQLAMMRNNKASEIPIKECLGALGVSLLSEWDVLMFLYRHRF